ncbi:MAG TPA: peptidoglycan DD-metalloendopeptidase family protein [Nitrospirota bacterium]|nr:peptidoglycan DD-metalloendopeptidase family protein [Nitrospirota bacterium]
MQDLLSIQQPFTGNIETLRNRKDPEAVKEVARQMESLFVYEMLKVMREASGKSSTGGLGSDTYTTMFDMELSKVLSERGIGLSDMIENAISAKIDKTGQTPAAPSQQVHSQKSSVQADIKDLLPDVASPRISSGYGMRHDPFSGELKFHQGLDIPAPAGTDIHPLRPGTVLYSGKQAEYGNVVIIDHGDGFTSKYAHNQTNLVQEGEKVDTASIIARVGSTGKSTGSHIHFEVAYKGQNVDPGMLLTHK